MRRAAGCLGALALALTAACGAESGNSDEQETAPEQAEQPVSSDRLGPEVVDGVLYPPGIRLRDPNPISVAQSKSGYVVTSGDYPYTVHVYSEDGTLIRQQELVHGMALSDPSSDLGAWITTSRPEDGRTRLVVIDTRTGDELENQAFKGDLEGVHGDEIVYSLRDEHLVLAPGRAQARPLTVDPPDDMLVLDFDADHVVFGDLESEVHVVDRDGSGVATFDDAYLGVLDPDGQRVAVLGKGGLVLAKTDGADQTEVDPDVPPAWGITWTALGDLVLQPFPAGDEEPGPSIHCSGAAGPCDPVTSEHEGQRADLLPNNAFGQMVSLIS